MYLRKKFKAVITYTTSILILFSNIAPTFAETQKFNGDGGGFYNSDNKTVNERGNKNISGNNSLTLTPIQSDNKNINENNSLTLIPIQPDYKISNEYDFLSTTVTGSVYSSNNKENAYLVGFKDNVNRDNFSVKKSLDKKVQKKFKMSKSVVLYLNQSEVQELKNDIDILFVEVDSVATIESTGPVLKDHSFVKDMKKYSQTKPWGLTTIGADSRL